MKLITVTTKAAFHDASDVTLDGVRDVLFRAISDGLDADVAYTEDARELTIDCTDPDYDADISTAADGAALMDMMADANQRGLDAVESWQERAREELARFGALDAIRALLVTERGQWRANVNGADLVQQLTEILTTHRIGGDGDEETTDTLSAQVQQLGAGIQQIGSDIRTAAHARTAALHVYEVSARCLGTIKELWTVRSARPLTRQEIEEGFSHTLSQIPGVTVDFDSQETTDEEGRIVTDIEVQTGELLDTCDECGAGIPDVDGGGLENRHHEASCSLYDAEKE